MLLRRDSDIVITVKPADRNPYFNMVVLDDEGFGRLVIQPHKAIYQRQSAPLIYDVATVAYATRPEFVLKANSMFEGKIRAVIVPRERAVDIDTELDVKFAEFLLNYQTAMSR